jgi:hypothetical protein
MALRDQARHGVARSVEVIALYHGQRSLAAAEVDQHDGLSLFSSAARYSSVMRGRT